MSKDGDTDEDEGDDVTEHVEEILVDDGIVIVYMVVVASVMNSLGIMRFLILSNNWSVALVSQYCSLGR